MPDHDPGVNALDLIAHCDEGKQLRRLERDFQYHRDRAIEENGGKMTVTITLACNILNRDEMTTSVTYKVAPAARKSAVDTLVHLDAGDGESTMHLTNFRQTQIEFGGPTRVIPLPTVKER